MKISRVKIQNYRSIKELDFSPGDYCVLVGKNNSGKSNILRAINLALGEIWPTERHFSEDDFYNQDTSKDILIQVFFDESWSATRNGVEVEIGGFELRCKAYKRRVGKKPAGSLKVDFNCLKPDGKTASCPSEPFRKGKKPQWLPVKVSGQFREEAASMIYVDVLREYNRKSPSSRWSILRRLFNEVNTEFMNDTKKLAVKLPDGSEETLTRRQAFEAVVGHAYQYLRTPTFEEIESALAKNVLVHMGLEGDASAVELHFESHDPTNVYKSLQLYIDEMGIQSPAGQVGAGLQSAIVVAIFRTYEELKKEGAVIAIEEPEVFLHPQKARYFASVLRSLTDNGNQVFMTTHSPVFIRIDKPETIAIVRRTKELGTSVQQVAIEDLAADERKALRLLSEFDSQRNEMFFASKVLFVEGNTEKVALPLVFRALGIDVNKENISIVECGGKTKIPLFARVARHFQIPHVVIADEDLRTASESWSEKRKKEQQEKNKKHRQWNQAILNEVGDENCFWLVPNLEGELGLPGNRSQKIDKALERFSDLDKANVPDCLREPITRLMSL